MAEIVNLRQIRKRKARADKTRAAERNSVLHGRSGAERARDAAVLEKQRAHLDAHLRDRPEDDSDGG